MPLSTFGTSPSIRNSSNSTPTTPITAAGSATALVAANAARLGLTIVNNSNGSLYVREALIATSAATTSNYDLIIPPLTLYEYPPNAVPTQALNGIGTGAFSGGSWVVSEKL